MTLESLEKLHDKKVNILGTEYTIKIGVADKESKNIVNKQLGVQEAAMLTEVYLKEIWVNYNYYLPDDAWQCFPKNNPAIDEDLTHELYHAFLFESGLDVCTDNYGCENGWARNEIMVDWLAKQFSKIAKVRKELGIKNEV